MSLSWVWILMDTDSLENDPANGPWRLYVHSLEIEETAALWVFILRAQGDLTLESEPMNKNTHSDYLKAVNGKNEHVGYIHRQQLKELTAAKLIDLGTRFDEERRVQVYKLVLKPMPRGLLSELMAECDTDILLEDLDEEPFEVDASSVSDDGPYDPRRAGSFMD